MGHGEVDVDSGDMVRLILILGDMVRLMLILGDMVRLLMISETW